MQDVHNEESLIEACQRELPHATGAFEVLVAHYEPIVYRFCLRILDRAADAEDAAQEVFIKVYRNIHRFEGTSKFRTWLFSIARNECLDRLRKRNQMLEVSAGTDDELDTLVDGDDGEPLLRQVVSTDLLDKSLRLLKPMEREVLALRYGGELSLDEIAETLSLSLSAAKMRLYRAVRHFTQIADRIGQAPASQSTMSDATARYRKDSSNSNEN